MNVKLLGNIQKVKEEELFNLFDTHEPSVGELFLSDDDQEEEEIIIEKMFQAARTYFHLNSIYSVKC